MGYNKNNDNDNVNVSLKNNYINNDNDKYDKSKIAELIADKLVDKLNNPNAFAFYCKVAYRLPEYRIWTNLESALNGKDPKKLFSWLCVRDMQ